MRQVAEWMVANSPAPKFTDRDCHNWGRMSLVSDNGSRVEITARLRADGRMSWELAIQGPTGPAESVARGEIA